MMIKTTFLFNLCVFSICFLNYYSDKADNKQKSDVQVISLVSKSIPSNVPFHKFRKVLRNSSYIFESSFEECLSFIPTLSAFNWIPDSVFNIHVPVDQFQLRSHIVQYPFLI